MSSLTKRIAGFVERHPTLYKCFLFCENAVKKPALKCQSCGQCVLSYNAFTCCMRCPKQLRNGPCGGTREDGHCEVYPDRHCVWWLINERAKKLGRQDKLRKYHIPVDNRNRNTSAWLNAMGGKIEGMSWSKELHDGEDKPPAPPLPPAAEKPPAKPKAAVKAASADAVAPEGPKPPTADTKEPVASGPSGKAEG